MKHAIIPALLLGLILVVPAVSKDGDAGLAKEVTVLKEKVAEQGALLKQVATYLDTQRGEAATLLKLLKKAGKQGFTFPAPNVEAKKALLLGLQRYALVASGGTAEPLKD